MSESRKRIILWLSALLGVLSASTLWLFFTRHPASGPTDKAAQGMGFTSSDRYNEINALSHGNNHLRDLSDAQFALIEDVLQKDGPKPRIGAIVAMNSVQTLAQQRRAIQIMKPHIKEKGVSSMVYFVLQTYARGNGRVAVEEMAQDSDPDARSFARTVIKNLPTRTDAAKPTQSSRQGG